MGANTISRLLATCLLLLFLAESVRSQSRDFDSDYGSRMGDKACLCGNRYWKSCPRDCDHHRKLLIREPIVVTKLPIPADELHSTSLLDHPDHVEEPKEISMRSGLFDSNQKFNAVDSLSDKETIVRHRKVYVSDKDEQFEPAIHAIDLTIPVKVNSEPADSLPPPKPVFRMHKYTTVETKPQVEMVPVTTTIIKPVGVSKDQIIED